jgi:hypothetical protein
MCASTVLSPSLHSPEVTQFEEALRSRIIGQEEGVRALVDLYQVLCADLNSPGRPLGSLLFLGPTAKRASSKQPPRFCLETRAP